MSETIHGTIRFRVVQTPWPFNKEPDFVKLAYVGLTLESWAITTYQTDANDSTEVPVYMVHLPVLFRAMATHNDRAYRFLVAQWGDIIEATKGATAHPISLPFPVTCCEQIAKMDSKE